MASKNSIVMCWSRSTSSSFSSTSFLENGRRASSDRVQLTRRTLETIAEYAFGVHVMTKSDLVVRDIDVLRKISRVSAAVSLIITTADDELSKKVEPGTPPSSARFRAMQRLSKAGIETRVALMPTLPFIEDSWENVASIIEEACRCGAEAIIPWFGTSMRDRQRAYYHHRLDELSPGLRNDTKLRTGKTTCAHRLMPRTCIAVRKSCARAWESRPKSNPCWLRWRKNSACSIDTDCRHVGETTDLE